MQLEPDAEHPGGDPRGGGGPGHRAGMDRGDPLAGQALGQLPRLFLTGRRQPLASVVRRLGVPRDEDPGRAVQVAHPATLRRPPTGPQVRSGHAPTHPRPARTRPGVGVGLPAPSAAGAQLRDRRDPARRTGHRPVHARAAGAGDQPPADVLPPRRRLRARRTAGRRRVVVLRVEGRRGVRRPGDRSAYGTARGVELPQPHVRLRGPGRPRRGDAGPGRRLHGGREEVRPQAGGFYGGWITDRVSGPFKGEPGSWGW